MHRQRHADVVLRHPAHRAHAAAAAGGLRLPVLGLRLDPGLRQRVRALELQRRGHRRLPRRAARLGLRGRAATAVATPSCCRCAGAPWRRCAPCSTSSTSRASATPTPRPSCRRTARSTCRRSTRTSCPTRPTQLMQRGLTALDVVRALAVRGFEVEAERVLDMLRQRLYGDYLQTSAIFTEDMRVLSALSRSQRLRRARHGLPHDGRAPRRDRRRAAGLGARDARRPSRTAHAGLPAAARARARARAARGPTRSSSASPPPSRTRSGSRSRA